MDVLFSVGDSEDIPQEIRAIRSLLANIAARAVMDYLGSSKKHVRQAKQWLFTSDDTDEWSFVWICEILGWDIDQIRRNVLYQADPESSCNTDALRRLNQCRRARLVRYTKAPR